MAHTKGPWTIHESTVFIDAGPARQMDSDGVTDEMRANALLIAAAPELLAECQRSLDMLLDWSKSDAWKRADPGFVNMKWRLENVIKKAKHGGD